MNGPSPESAPASLSVDASQDRGACLTRWLLGAPTTGRSASRQATRVQRQALHKTNMMVLVFWVWLRFPSSPGLYQAVFSTPGNDTLQAWARDQNTNSNSHQQVSPTADHLEMERVLTLHAPTTKLLR